MEKRIVSPNLTNPDEESDKRRKLPENLNQRTGQQFCSQWRTESLDFKTFNSLYIQQTQAVDEDHKLQPLADQRRKTHLQQTNEWFRHLNWSAEHRADRHKLFSRAINWNPADPGCDRFLTRRPNENGIRWKAWRTTRRPECEIWVNLASCLALFCVLVKISARI